MRGEDRGGVREECRGACLSSEQSERGRVLTVVFSGGCLRQGCNSTCRPKNFKVGKPTNRANVPSC